VFLTHVHLDHAGGAGQLMRALPEARAVVHPRGAPHMIPVN
jgi:glyoxylase-like metal-dependent hydrolase (beta-lactamase superfamily II)